MILVITVICINVIWKKDTSKQSLPRDNNVKLAQTSSNLPEDSISIQENTLEKRLEDRLIERMKQEVLAQMFVFESDYGRKINIMYEELMARNEKTEALEKSIIALERRVDKNSAFIFHYESQNATLEKTKH